MFAPPKSNPFSHSPGLDRKGKRIFDASDRDLTRILRLSSLWPRPASDSVCGLDVQRREILFDDRPPVPFDVLSIGIGSVPTRSGVESLDETVLAIKPMQTFVERLEDLAKNFKFNAYRPTSIMVDGECAAAQMHIDLTSEKTGERFEMKAAHFWTFEEKKPVHLVEYFDSALIAKQSD